MSEQTFKKVISPKGMNTEEGVPPPPPKCVVLSSEIIERTRKTDNLVSIIFGSSEYTIEIYQIFLQKYPYNILPKEMQKAFKGLMQHYFEEDIELYKEDYEFKRYLEKALLLDHETWSSRLPQLYREYRLAFKTINVADRKWFPEEIILLSSIFHHRIIFGPYQFERCVLDNKRLSAIFLKTGNNNE